MCVERVQFQRFLKTTSRRVKINLVTAFLSCLTRLTGRRLEFEYRRVRKPPTQEHTLDGNSFDAVMKFITGPHHSVEDATQLLGAIPSNFFFTSSQAEQLYSTCKQVPMLTQRNFTSVSCRFTLRRLIGVQWHLLPYFMQWWTHGSCSRLWTHLKGFWCLLLERLGRHWVGPRILTGLTQRGTMTLHWTTSTSEASYDDCVCSHKVIAFDSGF